MKPMLAHKYNYSFDPAGWWMSEKLDGVRSLWINDGFMSRNEKPFCAPLSFTKGIPSNLILDGELWLGRGCFNKGSGIVRSKKDSDWSDISYMVFDCVIDAPFEARQDALRSLILPSQVKVLDQIECTGRQHLEDFKQSILKLNGEGVMLRRACSMYEHKRSKALLKIKAIIENEATVIGYKPGKGKHLGRIGALVCIYKGVRIFVGTGMIDDERANPPSIGSTILFSYFEINKTGMPRFPVFADVIDRDAKVSVFLKG